MGETLPTSRPRSPRSPQRVHLLWSVVWPTLPFCRSPAWWHSGLRFFVEVATMAGYGNRRKRSWYQGLVIGTSMYGFVDSVVVPCEWGTIEIYINLQMAPEGKAVVPRFGDWGTAMYGFVDSVVVPCEWGTIEIYINLQMAPDE